MTEMEKEKRFWARLARHDKRAAFKPGDRVDYIPRPSRPIDPLGDRGTVFSVREGGMVAVRFDAGPHLQMCVPWRLKVRPDEEQGAV